MSELTPEQRKAKLSEINLLINAEESKLKRMYAMREKLVTLEADIQYHSSELKTLKKLKTVAKREAIVILAQ